MKIIHIIWALGQGGAESVVVDIVNEQVKFEDIHLIIVNNAINKALFNRISEKVNVHLIKRKKSSKNIIPIIKLNLLIYKLNPSIIHCHIYNLIYAIKVIPKSKIYLTAHRLDIPKKAFKNYGKIFSISNAVKKDILQRSVVKSKVIFNGISFEEIEEKENYCYDIFKIVQIGRLNHHIKAQHILIQAAFHLINNFKKEIRIDFYGEGESETFLKNLVKELDLTKYINFLGVKERSYLFKNLKEYELLCQPSFYEGFGIVILEAMAAKIPVLVSNVYGPMEIVKRGKYGYFFQSGDSEDCAKKILQVMEDYQKKEFLQKINETYKYAFANYSIVNTAKNYINNYF